MPIRAFFVVMRLSLPLATAAFLAVFTPNLAQAQVPLNGRLLASHEISMSNRYPVKSVNDVFRDNILLALYNFSHGKSAVRKNPDWTVVSKPFDYSLTLNPGSVFAFHDGLLPEFKNMLVTTTNSHFGATDGFKSDGYLYGDGVCHLASLMYWVAKDAGLQTNVPVNHDFAKITGVDKQHGVSIKYDPTSPSNSARQNLYITNNRQNPITFHFVYQNDALSFSISELQ